jgi:hypothetical protein
MFASYALDELRLYDYIKTNAVATLLSGSTESPAVQGPAVTGTTTATPTAARPSVQLDWAEIPMKHQVTAMSGGLTEVWRPVVEVKAEEYRDQNPYGGVSSIEWALEKAEEDEPFCPECDLVNLHGFDALATTVLAVPADRKLARSSQTQMNTERSGTVTVTRPPTTILTSPKDDAGPIQEVLDQLVPGNRSLGLLQRVVFGFDDALTSSITFLTPIEHEFVRDREMTLGSGECIVDLFAGVDPPRVGAVVEIVADGDVEGWEQEARSNDGYVVLGFARERGGGKIRFIVKDVSAPGSFPIEFRSRNMDL